MLDLFDFGKSRNPLRSLVAIVIFGVSGSLTITGQNPQLVPIAEPRPFVNERSNPDDTIEASAVVPIGDGRFLLVADDKDDGAGRSLLVVDRSTGKIVKRLTNFQGGNRNPKWEGLANLGSDYYIVGSHGADAGEPTEKLMARSRVLRFTITNESSDDPSQINIDPSSIREYEIVTALTKEKVFNRNRPENLKLEGLAVRDRNGKRELIFGLRAPYQTISANDRSMSFSVVYSAILPDPTNKKGVARLDLTPLMIFDAGTTSGQTKFPLHISSIDHIEQLGGFVVMTSSERQSDNAFVGNVIWFVSDREVAESMPKGFADRYRAARLTKLIEFQPGLKAEGISILPMANSGRLRFVVVYDNDAWSFRDRSKHISLIQEFELNLDKDR